VDGGQSPLAALRRLFEELGLNASQARVLAALLSIKEAPATQVPRLAEVPRTRAYVLLDELRERGLARPLPVDGPARWEAAPAEQVVDRLRTAQIDKFERTLTARRDVEEARLRDRLDELEKEREHRRRQVEEMAERVNQMLANEVVGDRGLPPIVVPHLTITNGILQVGNQYLRLVEEVESELLVINRGPYGVVLVAPEIVEALRRGVRIRTLYMEAEVMAPGMEDLRQSVEGYRDAGVETRVVDAITLALAVFDRKTVLCGLEDSEDPLPGSPTHMRIDHAGYAAQQADLFDHYWTLSRPYPEDRTPRSDDAGDDDVDVDLVGRSSAARRGHATAPALSGTGSPSDRRP